MKYEKIAEYNNKQFRRVTGVKNETFQKIVEMLKEAYAKKHQRRGRAPKLSIEDLLLATPEYLREYQTYCISQPAAESMRATSTVGSSGRRIR